MAIKITTDGFLKTERPLTEKYTINAIAQSLNTDEDYIKFVDMGSFVLVVDTAPERTMNSVGSLYFRFTIFGDLLIMSGQELPSGAIVSTDENSKWDIEQLESGIYQSIKEVLSTYKQVMTNNDLKSSSSIPAGMEPSKEKPKTGKTIYHFDPEKEGKVDSNEKEFMEQFYEKAYEVIKDKNRLDVPNLVLYEDYDVIIKFTPGKVKKTLLDMIDHFSNFEEYEKCSKIKTIADSLIDITQNDVNNAVQE